MGQDAKVPAGLWAKVRQIAREEVAKFAKSGFLRNATITGGEGLTVEDGGQFALAAANGTRIFYVGPVLPSLPDGSPQPGWVIRRADNTQALALFDFIPAADGTLNQALNWYDRGGNIVLADDTNSGQGIARPYVPASFYRARSGDWPSTTSASFETLFRAKLPKQQPRLYARAWGTTSVTGTTGEVRVMVNGTQLGSTGAAVFNPVNEFVFGPATVAGSHMDDLAVEIQARRTAGTGTVQVEPSWLQGMQT
jgi:hypothetical protein